MTQYGYFLPYGVYSGKYNMDKDEQLIEKAINNRLTFPILRFYGWSPACVSLGRNQNDEHINKQFCKDNNIDIVRRITGGRALLHDNELTYSFICPASFLKNGESIIESYKEISSALALGFKKLGMEVEFPQNVRAKTKFEYCMLLSTGADLSYLGKKIVGSAQFRKQGYILQHGSIMFDYEPMRIKNIFGEYPEDEKIAILNDILPDITVEELCNSIKSGVEEYFNIKLQTAENIF